MVEIMPTKNKTSAKAKKGQRRKPTPKYTLITRADIVPSLLVASGSNGANGEQPYRINPETNEERDKRLAKRKKLTLRAFQMAYENQHRRKVS